MSRASRRSRSSSKRSMRLSLSDELPQDLTFDIFESSEEEFAIDAQHPGSDEDEIADGDDDLSDYGAIAGTEPITRTTARRSLDLSSRQPSIRRVGSRQMLVFLTDGNSIGNFIDNYIYKVIYIVNKNSLILCWVILSNSNYFFTGEVSRI